MQVCCHGCLSGCGLVAVVWWSEIGGTRPRCSKQCLLREPAQLLNAPGVHPVCRLLTCHVACRMVTVLLGARGVLYLWYQALPVGQHRYLGEKARLALWGLSVAAARA
jgi:hypothetical protein